MRPSNYKRKREIRSTKMCNKKTNWSEKRKYAYAFLLVVKSLPDLPKRVKEKGRKESEKKRERESTRSEEACPLRELKTPEEAISDTCVLFVRICCCCVRLFYSIFFRLSSSSSFPSWDLSFCYHTVGDTNNSSIIIIMIKMMMMMMMMVMVMMGVKFYS